jgi:hypothetical protein
VLAPGTALRLAGDVGAATVQALPFA